MAKTFVVVAAIALDLSILFLRFRRGSEELLKTLFDIFQSSS